MDRHGRVRYPGMPPIMDGTYTIGQGISPGVAVLRCAQEPTRLQPQGDLVILDGVGNITIPNCRVSNVRVDKDSSGLTWIITLEDRRWRWLEFGAIDGMYNQIGPHGKLIPWTVRSPEELARLCLDAMGETGYQIDLPPGLSRKDVPDAADYFQAGENVPPTGTNPPVNWYGLPPAQALQQVCDLFGRRVVYRLDLDSIWVVKPGQGEQLPPGSIASRSPGIKAPAKPDIVAVMGDPTRFQVRLQLEAVGEEWNGDIKPIHALSYAPVVGAANQASTGTITDHPTTPGVTYSVTINGVTFTESQTGGTADTVITALAAAINASTAEGVKGVVIASAAGSVLTVTGAKPGVSFSFTSSASWVGAAVPSPAFTPLLTQPAATGDPDWGYSPPPLFPLVKATSRLTYKQAVGLAQKSVWRMYRICNVDVSGKGPINVPGFGPIKRRQQLVPSDSQVDQVEPEAADRTFLDREGFSLIVNFYNAYSRDKPAAVYGSVSRWLVDATYIRDTGWLTNAHDQVHVPFTVDPVRQLVIFSSPVYAFDDNGLTGVAARIANASAWAANAALQRKVNDGKIVEPHLVLQTAVTVRDSETNQFVRYITAGRTPGPEMGTEAHFAHRPDVQLNVTATYNDDGTVANVQLLEADAIVRGQHYLDGLKLSYPGADSESRTYNGIVPIYLDGAIAQLTWSIGPGGCQTVASRNTEHHVWIPPYPARRRAENLAPAAIGAANAADAARVNPMQPMGEGKAK